MGRTRVWAGCLPAATQPASGGCRENTEGEYSGLEHEVVPDVVESLKVITEASPCIGLLPGIAVDIDPTLLLGLMCHDLAAGPCSCHEHSAQCLVKLYALLSVPRHCWQQRTLVRHACHAEQLLVIGCPAGEVTANSGVCVWIRLPEQPEEGDGCAQSQHHEDERWPLPQGEMQWGNLPDKSLSSGCYVHVQCCNQGADAVAAKLLALCTRSNSGKWQSCTPQSRRRR